MDDGHNARPSRRGRVVAPAVALLIAGLTVTFALTADRVSKRQETDLLAQRAGELAALLNISTAETRAMLVVASNAVGDPAAKSMFEAVSGAATAAGTSTVAVVREQRGAFRVLPGVGVRAPNPGTAVAPEVAAVIARARTERGMVSGVAQFDGGTHAIFAQAARDDPTAIAYLDSVVNPARTNSQDPSSPFTDLDVAVYAADRPAADELVLVSGSLPGPDEQIASRPFQVGVDTWTVSVAARSPLVGDLAVAFPWLLLGAGLVTALMVGLLLDTMARRRSYALALVGERTQQLQEALDEIHHLEQAREQFFASVSHDIRAPLTAIMGFTEMMSIADPERQVEFLRGVESNTTRLRVMVDTMIDRARLHAGAMELVGEQVRLDDVVGDAVRDLAPALASHQVAVAGEAVEVIADRMALGRIMANVLVNAVRYSPPGSPVDVVVTADDKWGRVDVVDHGRGIDESDLEAIFEAFERGTRAEADGGAGLGLASVHELVRLQGGRVRIAAAPEGGTAVTIELPRPA